MEKSLRLGWDDAWMGVALVIAGRSPCVRRQVGAVIVDERNRIVATGYNGPPAGYPQPCVDGCPRSRSDTVGVSYGDCISIHAEANALLFCDRREREGGAIYVSGSVCWDCAKLIANSGLQRCVMIRRDEDEYRQPWLGIQMMELSGLTVEQIRP